MTKRALMLSEDFNQFWAAYPKRNARLDAWKAWQQLGPDPELVICILTALRWQVRQPDWVKDGGQYIPYPATWLRAGRWMDEQPAPASFVRLGKSSTNLMSALNNMSRVRES